MHTIAVAGTRADAPTPACLSLQLRQIRSEAVGINSYEFVDPDGAALPAFTAGAHIDLHLDGGLIRQYSLANDPAERHRYVIGVLKDDTGRGGSIAVHRALRVRDLVTVSQPRNNFGIAAAARRHVLLAGGIGLTPLKAMAHQFARTGASYDLHYCCKGNEFAAFTEELAPLLGAGRVHMHFDGGNARDNLDLQTLLAHTEDGTHVYYCGPAGFMDACASATAHWPAGTVHCEHFKAPGRTSAIQDNAVRDGFALQIASTGAVLQVPESKTIVEVLRGAGIPIDTSCEAGLCGTCKVRYVAGDVEHRDFILSDDEHRTHLTACVSRCTSAVLVLDL